MSATPTREQLDRYMDLVVAGEEPEDAIAVIWSEAPAAPKKPTIMVTEFPDGVVIGWDHCTAANGGCGKSVRLCTCKTGPKELRVFEQWRSGEKSMPDYAAAAKQAKAAGVPTSSSIPEGTTGVVVATVDADLIPCVNGEHLVDKSYVDKNDDGTYTCFDCQEKGVERPRVEK